MRKYATREDALEALCELVSPLPPVRMPPHEAVGLTLARDALSVRAVPHAPRSSRDGYAFAASDTLGASPSGPVALDVCGVAAPGDLRDSLPSGKAVRILTGAPMPAGADAVIMDEEAEIRDGRLLLKKTAASGDFVFESGHLLPAGVVVGSQGQTVTPGRAAVMTRSFVESVHVLPSPSAAVLSLGNEVVRPEETPNPGAFRSDNLVIATELLTRSGADVVVADTVDDTDETMDEAFSRVPAHGLVITMGGTGRGEHDLARASARRAGYEIIVDGVALRPGNSMFAAVRENSLLLGLPGPPFAVAPLLFAFAMPLVRHLRGIHPVAAEARLASSLTSRRGLEWLVPCRLVFDGPVLLASPLVDCDMTPLQEIAALDAYLPIPPDKNLSAGAIVPILCGPDFI